MLTGARAQKHIRAPRCPDRAPHTDAHPPPSADQPRPARSIKRVGRPLEISAAGGPRSGYAS